MEALTPDEAARRAGVSLPYLGRMIELGLVEADADHRLTIGAVRRLMVLQALEASGVSIDAIVTLTRTQDLSLDFVDSAGYEIFAPLADRTFGEVASGQDCVRFTEIGAVELKGVAGGVTLYRAGRAAP